MQSLLFLLFLIAMGLTLVDKHKASFWVFGVAIVLSVIWFKHHATGTLNILL